MTATIAHPPPDLGETTPVKLTTAIDTYIQDMRMAGRINSPHTERAYRDALLLHAKDSGNRDPRTTNRDNVKRTLQRWPNPNTQRGRRAILISFYDWLMEEGKRTDNPARQTRRPKPRPTGVYRLTREESAAMLSACQGRLETRAVHLGMCAGLRSSELRHLRGEHLLREGWVWVSPDLGKGGKQRWVPVMDELAPVIEEILETTEPWEFVNPGQASADPGVNFRFVEVPSRPMSESALCRIVDKVARRAGIDAHVHPHLMRHAYGDHVARFAGLKQAQALLGHAKVATTEGYVGQPTLDELSVAVRGLRFDAPVLVPVEEAT